MTYIIVYCVTRAERRRFSSSVKSLTAHEKKSKSVQKSRRNIPCLANANQSEKDFNLAFVIENRLKINSVQFDSFRDFNPNESESNFQSEWIRICNPDSAGWSKPNFLYESIRRRIHSDAFGLIRIHLVSKFGVY